MRTKGKRSVLSIEDKITICEHLDKGSSKSEITWEYEITVFIYFMYICLIIQTFWLSEQVLVPMGSDNQGSTVCVYVASYVCMLSYSFELYYSNY